ncbi:hypothetical protein CDD81_6121 [Ophiocordyceps australis]|uniref:P-loop containing nucleoside triphosphate hydrolase protein n=1 Tax=Ophiocordyceps australis TaxID=1399860 RepID=A0A2C5Y8I0_9HYPO|nr:hypothetical protein CDD81_6121 [Ophiocordyceps australis]
MDPVTVKLLLVGDDKCGKTTFLSRLSASQETNPIPLLRDIHQPFSFNIKIGKQACRLDFYDTSSPHNWRLLDPDMIVICYDISQRLSLINVTRFWLEQLKRAFWRFDGLPVMIAGLKRDLRCESDPNGVIYPQEAYQVAQAMRADGYVECSALTGELVELAFEDICRTAVKTLNEAGGQSEGGCLVQ